MTGRPSTPAQTMVRAWRLWLYWRGAVAVSATSLLGWAHYELFFAHPELLQLGSLRVARSGEPTLPPGGEPR